MAKERVKKQRWVPINSKGHFNDTVIGETLVGAGEVKGIKLEVSLMFLTNDMKK